MYFKAFPRHDGTWMLSVSRRDILERIDIAGQINKLSVFGGATKTEKDSDGLNMICFEMKAENFLKAIHLIVEADSH